MSTPKIYRREDGALVVDGRPWHSDIGVEQIRRDIARYEQAIAFLEDEADQARTSRRDSCAQAIYGIGYRALDSAQRATVDLAIEWADQ